MKDYLRTIRDLIDEVIRPGQERSYRFYRLRELMDAFYYGLGFFVFWGAVVYAIIKLHANFFVTR